MKSQGFALRDSIRKSAIIRSLFNGELKKNKTTKTKRMLVDNKMPVTAFASKM